jgi:dTDP-4-dehydrorhamnose 3,5-epimerase
MEILETKIPGVLIFKPRVFHDPRGWFMESWQQERYAQNDLPQNFVQDNLAYSQKGVLRGLHIQNPHGQGKLVQVIRGEVFDVAVDVRKDSPWFGQWVGVHLTGASHQQFYVPEGFAHGYLVLSDEAIFSYKCSDYYHPETQFSVLWDDPRIAIDWPLEHPPLLADKDREAPLLKDIAVERLPDYRSSELRGW